MKLMKNKQLDSEITSKINNKKNIGQENKKLKNINKLKYNSITNSFEEIKKEGNFF